MRIKKKMDKKTKQASKYLSLLLRHQPEKLNLTMSSDGWISIDELIENSAGGHVSLTHDLIRQIVMENDKQRFALDSSGKFIRASQGHSIHVDLRLEALEPPEVLYHGTATRFLGLIKEQGLIKRSRQHVHLSSNSDTAFSVATRHGVPVILRILARVMHEQGFEFYLSDNNVWLTDHVPARFLENGYDDKQ